MNVKFSQGQPLSDLPMLSELGVRWVRDTVDWATLERKPKQFSQFPGDFSRRLAFYEAQDIGVVFLLAYENNIAYPPTRAEPFRPIDPAAFGRYAVEVAKQLKASGVRFVLEIWRLITNEGRKRKPYYALKTLSEQLGASTLAGQVWGADHPTRGVQAFQFDTARSSTLVAWSVDPMSVRLLLRGPLANARIFDVYGRQVVPETALSGVRYLELGNSPHYIVSETQLAGSGAVLEEFEARVP